jgi:hypothetical protein
MISHIAHLSLATLISVAIGISPISVMAADPATATPPAATPTEKATEQKAKKVAKKEKKSNKKAKPAADAATQQS